MLDTNLVLSSLLGLPLIQRLGEELDLWIIHELWQILDNTKAYLSHPEMLMPVRPGEKYSAANVNEEKHLLCKILNQWETARTEKDLAGLKIFWTGDALSESLIPKDVDNNVIYRFESLSSSLDVRVQKRLFSKEHNTIIIDCFRDAAALTAALMPYRGFMLTQMGPKNNIDESESEPVICSYLREWGIRCYKVGLDKKTQIEREFLLPIFARNGISELIWAGLNLSIVHLVVPEAVIMPAPKNEDDIFNEDMPPPYEGKDSEEKDWWAGATCFWYSL